MSLKRHQIPIEMDFKKFHCHKCGNLLLKSPKTRRIYPGNADYKKYRKFGNTYYSGDIELTEYDFRCSSCHNIISFKEQCIYAEIQKLLNKKELTKIEMSKYIEFAKQKINNRTNNFVHHYLFCNLFSVKIK